MFTRIITSSSLHEQLPSAMIKLEFNAKNSEVLILAPECLLLLLLLLLVVLLCVLISVSWFNMFFLHRLPLTSL
jgi:hypothetical protein